MLFFFFCDFLKTDILANESLAKPYLSSSSSSSSIDATIITHSSQQQKPTENAPQLQQSAKTQPQTAVPKGFAALATKFNSNGLQNGAATQRTLTSVTSSLPSSHVTSAVAAAPVAPVSVSSSLPANGKVNHDDLFKKFRQSNAGSLLKNTSDKLPSPASSSTSDLVNKHAATNNISFANSNSNKIGITSAKVENGVAPKRNIFNTGPASATDSAKKASLVSSVKL